MSTRQNTKSKPDAESAYASGHLVARDLVARISELLGNMPAPGVDERPINWCDVGGVNEVNNRLTEMVEFLESTER